ncbi:MAG: hypothetical protein J6Q84_07340 [Kiritimatiellae bacterium]|nr:hypothetical protein [Kiritimatiellia bacterium]
MAETSKKLVWDQTGEKLYETGVEQAAIYPQVNGTYPAGAAWNGLISVTESPSGAEATPLYANNKKYLELRSNEEFGGTIEAYTYPDEFAECDGSKSPVAGVKIRQQTRKPFGLVYKTLIGNDEQATDYGYKLHLVYGCVVNPSEKANTSINESPEATTLSWEFTTTPIAMAGYKPFAHIEIDSTTVDADKLAALEDILYGTADKAARLPLPVEVLSTLGYTEPAA